MKKTITSSLIIFSASFLFAQETTALWKNVSENEIELTGKRDIVPEKYNTFQLDLSLLNDKLSNAPFDKVIPVKNSNIIIDLPMPDGEIQKFKVSESPVMDDVLQASFPNIRTYNIMGIDDIFANGKIDVTEFGFHGMIRSPKGDVFIDPYCKRNIKDYISYYVENFRKSENDMLPEVGVLGTESMTTPKKESSVVAQICAGANLKTYRLAIGCTAEYAIAATGSTTPTTAQTLAKVVTTVNRVDGIYETEVAVKLVLVATTTITLYTDVTTQPYTGNNNASTLINESQTVISTNIGNTNYDIGHTFSTGGGGLAQLGCVCSNSNKARGITGSQNPVGDPYDVDYVAHEIGHQFAGNHTFRSNLSGCSGNGNYGFGPFPSTAVEPGSGVTIMAYASLCGSDNITSNSIPYFHSISFDEIMEFITNDGGATCPVVTSSGNSAPIVTSGGNFTVPVNTPFKLTGSATDPNNDALTYQWEEVDVASNSGGWNSGTAPFFRSYTPTTSTSRNFPVLTTILSGNMQSTKGEYLPTTAQNLNFRFVARDNKMGGGGVCYATSQVAINSAGPFNVTSQNTTGITYPNGSTQTITWNVNGTNFAPINCTSVNIYVSTDNGNTFTLSLANTPNDGTENIVLPTVPSLKPACRVKVESVGNIFFDINDRFFAISNITGLNQYANSDNLNLTLVPNPFSSDVKIDISNTNNFKFDGTILSIYDVLGNLVKSENIELNHAFSKTYDLAYLSSGTYIVEVTDGKQKSVARLIKL